MTDEDLRKLLTEATPGPWSWEVNQASKIVELCGGRGASDLTVMSFARYGMSGAAPVFWTWEGNLATKVERADRLATPEVGRDHHAKWFARIDHPSARLIAAAPDLAAEVLRLRATLSVNYSREEVTAMARAALEGSK